MAFEPSLAVPGVEDLVLKALFIHGMVGKDFDNITNVHRVAKKVACELFHPKPEPDEITVLECVCVHKFKGFMVLVTDGSSRRDVKHVKR